MKKILVLLAASAALAGLPAQAAPASAESIEQLLLVSDSQKTLDAMLANVDQYMKQAFAEATKNEQFTPAQRKAYDEATKEMAGVIRQELSWTQLKPVYVQIYRDSFTQEEIDGLIAFYKSPAGTAFVRKMPVVMNKSMVAMQERMGPMMEKMRAVSERAMARAKAAK